MVITLNRCKHIKCELILVELSKKHENTYDHGEFRLVALRFFVFRQNCIVI